MFTLNYKIIPFFYINFLMSLSSRNFGIIILKNQSLNVSIVNFNSTENNPAREVDFSRTNTAEAAAFS